VADQRGNDVVHVEIRVTGKVQGVFYRASARERAAELGLSGTAKNRDDGSVVLDMHGPRDAIDQFVAWCREGPPRARVDHVDVRTFPTHSQEC
jgi:acylphosphatase